MDEKINEDERKPKVKTMNIQTVHEKFGHMDEARTRAAAAHLGTTIVRGTLKPCKDCATRKAKQKNVHQQSDHEQSSKPNEQFFLDIATIKRRPKDKPKLYIGKQNWGIMVDEHTQMKITHFFGTKSGMIEPTCEQLQ
jgi:hypothetical protein